MSRIRVQNIPEPSQDWAISHAPAANVQATITQAAPTAIGARNVCTGITVAFAGGATAPTAVNVTARLIDGVSGAAPQPGKSHPWQVTLSLPATAGASTGAVKNVLWIPGSPNTAMTLEFSANGGLNTVESVSMEGTVVSQ